MVLKTQFSFANRASGYFEHLSHLAEQDVEQDVKQDRKQLPQVTDRRSTIISRQNSELPLFFDRCFDKSRIKTFIGWLLANFGENTTVYIVEKLKNLGFYFATQAGISLSIDDLQVPSNKNWFLSQAEKDIKKNYNNFQSGNLTPVEQSQQLLDRWHRTSEILKESVIQSFRLTNTLNPVYMMAFSGARGNISQVRQLVGMRGLMADPQGQIISFPIRSNFREGLTLTEYVISCYGARKGVVDTALRTADSGYLTRRLVDVSQHVVVWTFDCKTDAGIHLTEMKEGKKTILSLKKRILGRVLAQEIPTIAFRNQQISAQLAQEIVSLREHVLVRSPLSCSVPNSVCQLCYGWSLSRGRIVSLGEAVGVIAAQSIGEPGTQLTMRTFHTGGVFSGDVIDEIRAPHDGFVHFLQPLLGQLIRTSHGKIAYLTRASGGVIVKNNLTEKNIFGDLTTPDRGKMSAKTNFGKSKQNAFFLQSKKEHTLINLEVGTALFVREGEKVIAKQLLAEYSSISAQTKERVEAQHQVYSDQKGEIFFDDVILGKKLKKEEPETEKALQKVQTTGFALNLQNQFKQNENQIGHFADAKMDFSNQKIQKIDPQSGRKIDIVTSLKLNTLWILSGTFFEPPVSSPLYAKIGDLVDKTTLLTVIQNKLNLQTSHLGGEYILSAQLNKNKITRRKEKLLTFFRKDLISSKFSHSSEKDNFKNDKAKENPVFLNEFSLNLIITNIKYKKSGYFFTNYKKEKVHHSYSFFLQTVNLNLFNNLKSFEKNQKILYWNYIFSKTETNFPSDVFLQSKKTKNSFSVTEEKYDPFFLFSETKKTQKNIKNFFILAEPKQIKTFLPKPNKSDVGIFFPETKEIKSLCFPQNEKHQTPLSQKEIDILRLFAANKVTKTEFILENLKKETAFFYFLKRNPLSRNIFEKEGSKIFKLKYSKESAKAKNLWWRSYNLPVEGWIKAQLFFPEWVPKLVLAKTPKEWLIKKINFFNLNDKIKVIRKAQNSFYFPFLQCKNEHEIHFSKENSIFKYFVSNLSPLAEQNVKQDVEQNAKNTTHLIPQNTRASLHFAEQNVYLASKKLRGNKKNINHFFTTTSLNQPFSNHREFKNEFVLQWFSPLFKTEAGGLIYTNNDYCNKRSIETHIFFTAEENYGKKDLVKLNFGKRKKSFHVVSFKELITPSICLTNVFLDGQKKPSSSFKNSFISFSEDFANILSVNESAKDKYQAKPLSFSPNFDKGGEAISINSLLNEIHFLQNKSLKKELFFLTKKENFNLYSVSFHFTRTETPNTTINLLKKGFLSFKNKWVETDIPLGYQKNLQGNQIPFYSIENGLLKNKLSPSFFTNQYSNYWTKKKNNKSSVSFLKNFSPLILKQPLPQIKLKKRNFNRKRTSFINGVCLSENKFFGRNTTLIKNFNRKSISEKLYQKKFWLANPLSSFKNNSSFLCKKSKIRFSLTFLLTKLHLNQNKKNFLKFNPFPSKGSYSSSALIFRINMRAISLSDFQKQNSVFYNPYPYSSPLFVDFLQNKSATNFQHLTKSLRTNSILQNKNIALQSKTLFFKRSLLTLESAENKPLRGLALQTSFLQSQKEIKSNPLTGIKADLKNKYQENLLTLSSTQQKIQKQKQENNFKNLQVNKEFEKPFLFPTNQPHKNQKFGKFSALLQKQIKKIHTKRKSQTNGNEKLQRPNLQIRPGWLYLPKDQFQAAKIHQSFISPFQQNLNEILFDQFPVYIESILRKSFEEQLPDIYLQPSTNVVDFSKTKTLVEKSQLQKFINKVSTISKRSKQSNAIPNTPDRGRSKMCTKASFAPNRCSKSNKNLKIYSERSNKFLLSLRETLWRGSTFSSFVEKNLTFYDGEAINFAQSAKPYDNNKKTLNKSASKLAEKENLYLISLPINSLSYKKISSTSSFLSFLLRNKKDKENHKHLFLRPVSINPIKIVFQVVTNKSCRFNSIQSFALSSINNVNLNFSQDFFLQGQIIDRKLGQNKTDINKRVNPGFFFCLPQISRIYFIKNKPFSDFIFVSCQLNFNQIKIKNNTSNTFAEDAKQGIEDAYFGQSPKQRFDQIKNKERNLDERLVLSEKNENLICKGKQILIPINKSFKNLSLDHVKNKVSNRLENLPKILQNKIFLIQSFSRKVDINYLSFLISVPNLLKNKKSANTGRHIPKHSIITKLEYSDQIGTIKQDVEPLSDILQSKMKEQAKDIVFNETLSFQTQKPSFLEFFNKKSKLWLLIRHVSEHPLLNTSISQQKTKLHKRNQTFFEKELIYSSTPLSLYMSNKILFSSKFNKQRKKETYLSFYQSPKTSLKIKENIFYLLNTFPGLEKQLFTNFTIDLTKNGFFDKAKFFENKLKLPLHLFCCQNVFWQVFDLHHQNVQKNKLFEGKSFLFEKKIFDTKANNLLKDKVILHFDCENGVFPQSENGTFLCNKNVYKQNVEKRTWFSQKENLENVFFPQENQQTIIRSFKQSFLLHFFLSFNISKQSPLQRIGIKTTFEEIEGNPQTSSCILQGKMQLSYLNSPKMHINTKESFLKKKVKFCKYFFTPFARDLSFTLFFTAKLNQSWFFSLVNNGTNKKETFNFRKIEPLQGYQSSNKTQLNKKNIRQEYLKDRKLISKESSSYPLKERSSHTTLLLDQTITTRDKTPVAITAIMSREEGEIENFKNHSVCLILKNSDIEILLTKNEKPRVVVGQLIRYGEQIANGIATPKSGQIIQVDANKVTLRKAQPILFPRGGSVDVNHGDYVKEGSPLLSLSYQRLVTGDIVQGIPKIEQLFEARETEGGQPLLSSLHSELEAIFLSYSTQLGLKLAVRESFKEIQQIIVDRVQKVYIAQGVLIADKHFEVVIRQMTSKVRILDGGRPGFLYGELVDLRRVELLNAGVPFANEQALYEPIILGISKACLEAEGFLSPASFQETTRVLSLAAIERKTDFLRGIKERVILGDVIQAGTGFTLYDRPVRKIKQEECIDLSLAVLHNSHFTLSTNRYHKQL